MDDHNISWLYEKTPDFTLEDLEYLKGKTHHHDENSREFLVESLMKTWEMEQ